MKKRKQLLLTVTVFMVFFMLIGAKKTSVVYAVSAYPSVILDEQPDGEEFEYYMRGDENFHYYVNASDVVILKDKADGEWKQVCEKLGKLYLGRSAKKGKAINALTVEELNDDKVMSEYYDLNGSTYIKREDSDLEPFNIQNNSNEGISTFDYRENDAIENEISEEDELVIPTIAIVAGFSDMSYREDYDWGNYLFSGENSITTYYESESNGMFTFGPAMENYESANSIEAGANDYDNVNDGVIHVKLDMEHGDWDSLVDDEAMTEMQNAYFKALQAASEYIDFQSYDTDGDGEIVQGELSILFIAAGYEAATGDITDSVWAHQWQLMEEYVGEEYDKIDNVWLAPYITIGEQANIYGEAIHGLTGTVTHELGHILGLPDLYDIFYTEEDEGAPWYGYVVENTSLMGGGSWGMYDGEFVPTCLDPLSRISLGIISPMLITDSGDYEIIARDGKDATNYQAYIIPVEGHGNEYYIVENRQYSGFDLGLTDGYIGVMYEEDGDMYENNTGGMMIWHVDDDICKKYWNEPESEEDENQINVVWHQPGNVPVYLILEDINDGKPMSRHPFYTKSMMESFNQSMIELLAYNGEAETPADQINTGTRISIVSEEGNVITINVSLKEDREMQPLYDLAKKAIEEAISAIKIKDEKVLEKVDAVNDIVAQMTDKWKNMLSDDLEELNRQLKILNDNEDKKDDEDTKIEEYKKPEVLDKKPVRPQKVEAAQGNENSKAPQTSDNYNMEFWLIMMAVTGIVVVIHDRSKNFSKK